MTTVPAELAQPLLALKGSGPLLVACSGGADSMGLAEACLALALPIELATVDHGLHPLSAAHARFVETAFSGRCPVHRLVVSAIDLQGEGMEDSARRARLALLEGCAAERGLTWILTAHTAEDQAETLLMRLADGAGLRGMRGIPELRAPFRRPWLGVSRRVVKAYLEQTGQRWVDDPTNALELFTRNRLRQAMGPLSRALGPGWALQAARSARHLASASEALHWALERVFPKMICEVAGGVLVCSSLAKAPLSVRAEVLRSALERVGAGRALGPSIDRLDDLLMGLAGPASLPGGLEGRRFRSGLFLGRLPVLEGWSPVQVLGPGVARCGAARLIVERVTGAGPGHIAASCAPFPWSARVALPGERYRPHRAPGQRVLGRLWMDIGVPREWRAALPVLESAGQVIWAAGLRAADHVELVDGQEGFKVSAVFEGLEGWTCFGES